MNTYVPDIEISFFYNWYLVLDLKDQCAKVEGRPSYENGVPMRVWNGAALQWRLPACPDADEVREALSDESGVGGELKWFLDHYTVEYNSSANLTRVALDDDADEQFQAHLDAVEVAIGHAIRPREVWRADDWFAGIGDAASLTQLGIGVDDEITDDIVEAECAEAVSNGAYLRPDDVKATLVQIQARVRANREEDQWRGRVEVRYTPADVSVSDDRGSVKGARVEVDSHDGEDVHTGTVIPPEGNGLDCWISPVLYSDAKDYRDEVIEALREAASEGSRGLAGSISVDVSKYL